MPAPSAWLSGPVPVASAGAGRASRQAVRAAQDVLRHVHLREIPLVAVAHPAHDLGVLGRSLEYRKLSGLVATLGKNQRSGSTIRSERGCHEQGRLLFSEFRHRSAVVRLRIVQHREDLVSP